MRGRDKERTIREILFRAKRIDTGEWVEGCYLEKMGYRSTDSVYDERKLHIIVCTDQNGKNYSYDVIPETVEQFTGLKDKDGKKIFEGDAVRRDNGSIGYIIFLAQTMSYRLILPKTDVAIGHRAMGCGYHDAQMLEVIGNIHDNPELLSQEKS